MEVWLSYRLEDFLMFSPEVYWRQFALQNAAFWPVAAAATGLFALILAAGRRPRRWTDRAAAALLGAVWIWLAWSFLWERYAAINLASAYVAPVFAVEGVLVAAFLGGAPRRVGPPGARGLIGAALVAYAVALHPFVPTLSGRPLAQAELFGLAPDPTAIATLGLLLFSARRGLAAGLMIVPALWLLVSAATLHMMSASEAWIPLGAAVLGALALMAPRAPRPAHYLTERDRERSEADS